MAVMTMIIIQLGGAEEERQLKVSKLYLLYLSKMCGVKKFVRVCVCVCVCGGYREASLGIEISLLHSSILVNLCSENSIACLYLNPRAQFYFNNMLM